MTNSYSKLLTKDSPREYLKEAFNIQFMRDGKVNYAEISRKCGFSSRSFLSEYLKGRKNLSYDSINKITEGIKLPRNYSLLFKYLVYQEHPSLDPNKSHQTQIEQKIHSLKEKIKLESKLVTQNNEENVVGTLNTFLVYASLGSPQMGATVEEIQLRSNLTTATIRRVLSGLNELKLVRKNEDRYFVTSNKLDFFGLGSHQGLSLLISEACLEISKHKNEIIENKDNLVLFTALSINSSDLPKIKEEMRNAIFDILDKYQADTGNKVIQVFTSATGPLNFR